MEHEGVCGQEFTDGRAGNGQRFTEGRKGDLFVTKEGDDESQTRFCAWQTTTFAKPDPNKPPMILAITWLAEKLEIAHWGFSQRMLGKKEG
eukprot:3338346-Rhodomonas_salina.2